MPAPTLGRQTGEPLPARQQLSSEGRGDLDQVAARIVEDRCRHGTHGCRLLREPHAERLQSLVLRMHVVDGE